MKIEMEPIGYVRNEVKDRKDVSWGEDTSSIVLDSQCISGLKGLEDFSHVIILYHLDKAKYEKDKHLQRRPQNREDMPLVGIFSQRGNADGRQAHQRIHIIAYHPGDEHQNHNEIAPPNLSEWPSSKRTQVTNFEENVKKRVLFHIVSGNAN